VPIVNISTGKVISRQEAATIMFGTPVKTKAPVKKRTPAKKAATSKPATSGDKPIKVPTSENIDKSIKSGVKGVPKPLSGGAIAVTTKVEFNDGSSGVQKIIEDLPDEVLLDIPAAQRNLIPSAKYQQDAEELGSMFARALGLSAPEVTRVNQTTTIQQFKPGKVGGSLNLGERDKHYGSDDGLILAVTDQVIGNNDRNLGNWLSNGNQIIPIDFSGAWNLDEVKNGKIDGPMERATDQFQRKLRDERSGAFKDNDIAPEDMDRMRDIMTALRPEFAKRRRLDEWQWSMNRIAALRQHAKGTRRRIK
jgi:hypothetical protein